MAVPYTFATATSPIPLSQLDTNFGTPITLGNTAIQLGNTVTQLNNMTLANVSVASVAIAFPNNFLANSTATLGNAVITLGSTTTSVGNLTLSNVTISSVSTPITAAQGGTGLTAVGTSGNVLTSNGTAWLSQAPAAATGNVTFGNTTVALGGTSNNIGNLTLANVTVTNYTETLYTSNTGTAITVSLTNGTVQKLTMNASPTITMPTAVAGKSFVIMLAQNGTGGYSPTWSTVVWPGNTAPTVTSTASKQDIYSFFSDGTSWYGATIGQNY